MEKDIRKASPDLFVSSAAVGAESCCPYQQLIERATNHKAVTIQKIQDLRMKYLAQYEEATLKDDEAALLLMEAQPPKVVCLMKDDCKQRLKTLKSELQTLLNAVLHYKQLLQRHAIPDRTPASPTPRAVLSELFSSTTK